MSKKLTKEEFIKKAKEKHGDKYDYSKVEYVNAHTKVCIKCHEHGEFEQRPSSHTNGNGCPKCSNDKKTLSKEDFIKKANEVHHGKYCYDKVEYVNCDTKVCIKCSKHGEFCQTPHSHLQGQGCPTCANENKGEYCRSSKEEFIKKARKEHGDKYDYSKVDYVNAMTKVCIICKEHGEFWQTPSAHTQGSGCHKCANEATSKRCRCSKEEFIKKANEVHQNKYDYSNVRYCDALTKVCIICLKHGKFWQQPNNHLSGAGCHKCANEAHGDRYRFSKEDFIKKANEVHKGKYCYDKVEYVNCDTKVCIICKKHGEFEQTPYSHTKGAGCPTCNLSHLERSVMNYLDENGITYSYQKRFNWLGRQSLDFYLPDYKVGIECQGEQHFFPIDFAGKGVEWACKEFDKINSRDKRKKALCEKHGIKLLYFGNVPNYNTFLGEVVHDDVQYLIDFFKK
jgi:hypothetical protein